jgi:hypothetical protein
LLPSQPKLPAQACTPINQRKDFDRCSRFVFQEHSKTSREKRIERDLPFIWCECKNPAEKLGMFAT